MKMYSVTISKTNTAFTLSQNSSWLQLGRHRFQFYDKCEQVQVDLGCIKKSWTRAVVSLKRHKSCRNIL